MKGMERRLASLEGRQGLGQPSVGVIIRSFVRPGPDGPEDTGSIAATIVSGPNKGLWLTRGEGEPEAAFFRRVEVARIGI
jgi:hypothetical protein